MSALNKTADVFQALSDKNRLRALLALRHGELCVCQLIELLDLAPSTVSKHLSILRDAGLIQSRKDGRWVYYSLAENSLADSEQRSSRLGQADFPMIGKIIPHLFQSLENSPEGKQERQKLKAIKNMDTEKLCRRITHRK